MSEIEELSPETPPTEMSDMAQQIADLQTNAAETADIDAINEGLESTMDVPESNFWDNASPSVENEVLPTEIDSVSNDVPDNDQIIKFKAFGQEKELSFEEAGKRLGLPTEIVAGLPTDAVSTALSKIEGGNQAFSKLAEANKRVKQLESSRSELEKKASLIDKLEEVKHDWKQVLQIATGQDPDTFLKEAMRKQRILELGSDGEKNQLEKEERLAMLERKLEAQRLQQEELSTQEQTRLYGSEKLEMKSLMTDAFNKHKLDLGNETDSNDVNEMLWDNSRAQMAKYVTKYKDHPKFKELLPKMAQKSFEDVAGKFNRLTTGQVQTKVDEAIKNKKQQSQEKAAIASTRRISEPNSQNFEGMSVREIADRLVGKKKFSF